MDSWLTIVETPFQRRSTSGHPDAQTAAVAFQWTGRLAEAPDEARAWLERLAPAVRAGEGVDKVAIEIRRARRVDVSYRVAGIEGLIRVASSGVGPAVRAPFQTRAAMILLGAVAAGGWAFVVWIAFVSRHIWYSTTGASAVLALVVLPLTLGGAAVAAELCVPSVRVGRRSAVFCAVAALLVTQGAAAALSAPSMDAAEAAFAGGDVGGAAAEATACAALDLERARARGLLDRVRLAQVKAEADLSTAAALASEGFHDEVVAMAARGAVRSRVEQQVASDQAAGTWDTTEPLVGLLPEPERTAPVVVGLLVAHALHRLDGCIERLDAGCSAAAFRDASAQGAAEAAIGTRRELADAIATSRAAAPWAMIRGKAPLTDRERACSDIRPLMAFAAAAGAGSLRPSPSEVDAACARVAASVEAESRRAETEAAAKAKRDEAARAREAQRREAAAAREAWSSAPLRCGDGTWSRTCTCGNPHAGCCSRHGGVAGCSR